MIEIKRNNYKITVTYQYKNGELNGAINNFVIHVVFQNVGLYWIIENKNNLKFDMNKHCNQRTENGPWYNTTILSQLNSKNFEDYLKKGHRYRYELMCDVDECSKDHIPMPDNGSSGGDRPMTISSYKEAVISLVQTINFIDNFLQYFEEYFDNIIESYKQNMRELFKKLPTLLPQINLDDYKTKYQTTIKAVGEKWYI